MKFFGWVCLVGRENGAVHGARHRSCNAMGCDLKKLFEQPACCAQAFVS